MANGLLDFIKTPEGQGLLSAAFGGLAGARRGQPLNSLGRAGMAGMMGYGGALDREQQTAEAAQAGKYRDMQLAALQDQMERAKAAATQATAKRDALPGLFAGATTGGGTVTPEMGGVPMFSQGSTAAPMRTEGAGRLDVMGALKAGYTPDEIAKLGDLPNVGRQKVARTVKGMGPDGREFEYQVDEFGGRVGDGLPQYRAPLSVNQGDRQTFVDPYSLKPAGSFAVNQSPDSRASNAITIRGQNLTDARARDRLTLDQGGGKPEWRDGQWVVPPKDMKPGESRPVTGPAKTNDAREALDVIKEAKTLIPQSTGSGIGALVDSTAGFFGAAPEGAQVGARLKALEGNLVAKMPKMSGPQSDKDVLLYKQMAGQIGDTSLPVSTRMAALETIKGIQQRYSAGSGGASGGWDSPAKSGGWSIQKAD